MLPLMTVKRCHVVLVLFLLVVAPASACTSDRECTLVGAEDMIVLEVELPAATAVGPTAAELCLDGRCRPRQEFTGERVSFAGSDDILKTDLVDAEVRLYEGAELTGRARAAVWPMEFAPNGRECGPVVNQAFLVFDTAAGTLRQVPFDAGEQDR